MDLLDWFSWLEEPIFTVGGEGVPWADLLGNIAAVATIALAMRRSVLTWPVQIAGSLLLIVASLSVNLGGNAARQVVIIVVGAYGWWRWTRRRRAGGAGGDGAVAVRFATTAERIGLLALLAVGTSAFALLLDALDASWAPWPDAYIFVGSLVAMLAQARGLVEFWFAWILVDVVGVPLAVSGGLLFSGAVYTVMFVMVLFGLRDWWRRGRQARAAAAAPAVPGPSRAPGAGTPSEGASL
ncbi:nicotinamide riboside transporter PnuC [Allostreptomyces psammosilenae]|uniref:Nicotinamide mononucleotide transporter n=1 Tax=Allostreptomyces psammosilenae TaxID=1892865 RepID=A0A853A1G7_9ACTN|nr:nicotinamide riboside transporter PnuC [Allostreptomyces psammosilenae]NYI04248.1 nicotinamide mononucleotide transporter [Allostreptomyces psammosilenae]